MRFDNYYVSEYKRVLDNVKVNEDKLSNLAEKVEDKVASAKSEANKKIMMLSATAVAVGVGICMVARKRK